MNELEACLRRLRHADELRGRAPRQALELAYLARDEAARFDPVPLGQPLWRALQADAWAVLSSCWRSCGDLHRAESALTVAWTLLGEGPLHDPLAPSRLAQRAARLRGDQGRFEEALRLVASAREDFERQGDRAGAAGAAIDQALLLARQGHVAPALEALEAALARFDPRSDPRLVGVAQHDRALLQAENAQDAHALAGALGRLADALAAQARSPDGLPLLKTCALAARLGLQLGQREQAGELLWACREAFEAFEAAEGQLVCLLHLLALALLDDEPGRQWSAAGYLLPLLGPLEGAEPRQSALRELVQAAQRRELDASRLHHFVQVFYPGVRPSA